MDVDIRYQTPTEICAIWGAVVIRICDGTRTEQSDLVRVEALFDELLQTRAVIGMLVAFTHETPLPTPATQRHAATSMSRFNDRLVLAVAMLGLGFWASAFRATLDTLMRVIRRPIAIESSAPAAARRLAEELIGIDPDALVAVYEQLNRELARARMAG